MKGFFSCIALSALIATTAGSASPSLGQRVVLIPPRIEMVLGDTKDDYTDYDKDMQPHPVDSHVEVSCDATTGTYHYKFKTPDGKWQKAEWEPASQVDVAVFAAVSEPNAEGYYSYNYTAYNLKTSRQDLEMFYLRHPCEGKASGGDHFFILHGMEGDRPILSSWSLRSEGEQAIGKAPGDALEGMSLQSRGFPTVVQCYARGVAPLPKTTEEVPGSIELAWSRYHGLYTDSVRGLTVGPGSEVPTLELLQNYLSICRYQGWVGESESRLADCLREAQESPPKGPKKPALLRILLRKVSEITQGNAKDVTPELDALIRLNVAAMLAIAEQEAAAEAASEEKEPVPNRAR